MYPLDDVYEYVQNGRVDSMKEVVNLLETEMHQQRMEENALLGAYYANKVN